MAVTLNSGAMKKLSFLTVFLIFFFISTYSQSCLPEGITFDTQSQIDSFQINYPGCTEIEGFVNIGNSVPFPPNYDINNLNGLSVLTSIGSSLAIVYVFSMPSLSGLENLTSIGGGLIIVGNYYLSSLSALENVTSIEGELSIVDNTSFLGLTGLDNIESYTISDLLITGNSSLSTCEVESVCAYLSSPNGDIIINSNANGCNSPEEVQDSCEANAVNIDEQFIKHILILYPNPANKELNISAEGFTIDEITIYTLTGQQVMQERSVNGILDISRLQPGMYIVEVTVENVKLREKLIVQ